MDTKTAKDSSSLLIIITLTVHSVISEGNVEYYLFYNLKIEDFSLAQSLCFESKSGVHRFFLLYTRFC